MKKVTIQTSPGLILSQGDIAADGVLLEGEDTGLVHIVEAILRGKVDAGKKANNEYQSARKALTSSRQALDEAFAEALTFATVTRDNLKPKLGSQHSQAWVDVGFVNNTLMIPRGMLGSLNLVSAMGIFLDAHPELNIADVATPAIATAKHAAFLAARSAVGQADKTLRMKRSARDAAVAEVRKQLIGLRRELSMLLSNDDPRWVTFGFSVPSDLTVPEVPEGVAVVPGVAGHGSVSWNHAMRADRYHVYKQTVGVDAEPVRVATVRELSTDVGGLVSGSTVKFTVTALNAAGESLDSAVVELAVG